MILGIVKDMMVRDTDGTHSGHTIVSTTRRNISRADHQDPAIHLVTPASSGVWAECPRRSRGIKYSFYCDFRLFRAPPDSSPGPFP